MALLIPRAWNKAKDAGRAEGHAAGRTEGRAGERERVRSILAQHARRDPETGNLILDQDAVERIRNGSG